jgi:hypothetical protein
MFFLTCLNFAQPLIKEVLHEIRTKLYMSLFSSLLFGYQLQFLQNSLSWRLHCSICCTCLFISDNGIGCCWCSCSLLLLHNDELFAVDDDVVFLLFLFLVVPVLDMHLDVVVVWSCDIDDVIIGEDDGDNKFNDTTCEVVEEVLDEVVGVDIIDETLLVGVDEEVDNVLEDGLVIDVYNGVVNGEVNGVVKRVVDWVVDDIVDGSVNKEMVEVFLGMGSWASLLLLLTKLESL